MTRRYERASGLPDVPLSQPARTALSRPQWEIYRAGWDETARFRVAVCGRRFGKALDVKTPLASPSGWTTMGAVQPGDLLFDECGQVCRVVFATDVMLEHPCFRVTFDDDSHLIADQDHLWWTEEHNSSTVVEALHTTGELAERLPTHGLSIRTCAPLEVGHTRLQCKSQHNHQGLLALPSAIRRQILKNLLTEEGAEQDRDVAGSLQASPHVLTHAQDLLHSLGYVCRCSSNRLTWSRPGRRFIRSIEPVRSVPVRCIQVDSPSRLYLCGKNLIPTHNTFLMAEELRRAVKRAVQLNIGIENEIWYGAPTFVQAKRVMWSRLKQGIPHRWLLGPPNETSCLMRLVSGHVIRVVGLDSFENLRGSGLWFFGGDEWADCKPEAWSEVIRPMLSTSRGHALFIGTPKGFDHFRDAYLLGQPGGDPSYRSFLFTTLDGGNVPEEEVEAAQRQLDPRTFRQEYGASFETYAGRVIYAFSRAENVRPARVDPLQPLHIGMDFNINPMSATVWQEHGETLWQVDEIVMPTSNTDEMVEEIVQRHGRTSFDPGKRSVGHITIYPDPAGAQRRSSAAGRTDIGILRDAGFKVRALSSHPSVRDRTNVVNRHYLSADGMRRAFVDPRCVKSIEAYERLVYREGTSEPDKSAGYDHLVDATGYYMFGRLVSAIGASANSLSIMER